MYNPPSELNASEFIAIKKKKTKQQYLKRQKALAN